MAKILTREPDWLSGDLGQYSGGNASVMVASDLGQYSGGNALVMVASVTPSDGPIQQSDLLKPLLMDIAKNGLAAAYNKFRCAKLNETPEEGSQPTSKPKHVIIVGAGMAGLVAAYELAKAKHKVSILEMQTRVGGRVKTFGEKEGFAKGLYVDGKAYACSIIIASVCRFFLQLELCAYHVNRKSKTRPTSSLITIRPKLCSIFRWFRLKTATNRPITSSTTRTGSTSKVKIKIHQAITCMALFVHLQIFVSLISDFVLTKINFREKNLTANT